LSSRFFRFFNLNLNLNLLVPQRHTAAGSPALAG
jgi:hypothetical protein